MKQTFDHSLRAAAKRLQAEARAEVYRNDPVAWAEDVLGAVLWSKQKEILRSVAFNKRTAVKSCHSIGKTFICSVAAAWWTSTRDNGMVQSTAPTYQQVHAQLWEEIRTLHTRANLRGRVTLGDQWLTPYIHDGRTKDRLVGEGKKPADSNIHGFHGTHRPDGVFAILDEGCGIAQSIFTGAEAITTSRIDRLLTTGNPDDPNTEFGRIFDEAQGEWNLITVSAYDTPNFTSEGAELIAWAQEKDADLELVNFVNDRDHTDHRQPHMVKVMAILEHMPDPEWIESRKRDWGEESPRFLSKVLAQFPLTSVDSLFSGSDIETARNNLITPDATAFRVLGVDVARYGADKTVVALNVGGHVEILAAFNSMDIMEVSARVHKLALEENVDQVRVDGIGVGGGVVDRLVGLARASDNRYTVVEMTAGATPPDRTLHRNSRAYWYDTLKHQMRNGLVDIPDPKVSAEGEFYTDEEIIKAGYAKQFLKELTGVKYGYPNGIMQIESKEDIRRRGDKSPDFVDAVVMATAPINNIVDDPLSVYRPGQVVELDVMADMDMLVSLY